MEYCLAVKEKSSDIHQSTHCDSRQLECKYNHLQVHSKQSQSHVNYELNLNALIYLYCDHVEVLF